MDRRVERARPPHHVRGRVDAEDAAFRDPGSDLGRHLAVAAADVEDGFIACELELLDEFPRPVLLLGGVPLVVLGIPRELRHRGWWKIAPDSSDRPVSGLVETETRARGRPTSIGTQE